MKMEGPSIKTDSLSPERSLAAMSCGKAIVIILVVITGAHREVPMSVLSSINRSLALFLRQSNTWRFRRGLAPWLPLW